MTQDNDGGVDRIWLRDLLATRFNLDELRSLCFDLNISYENLAGDTRPAKARELVAYCERHGRTDDLVAALRQQRSERFADATTSQRGERGPRHARPGATLEGEGSIAQGGSVSLGAGAIYIVGNVEGGQLVSGSNNTVGGQDAQRGGIRVGKIVDSDDVTIGANLQGGSAADAAALTREIMSGGITVDEVTRSNKLTVGLHHIADPASATLDDLRQEVAALREQLAALSAEASLNSEESQDAEEAATDLATAHAELAKAEPHKGRVLRNLKKATEVLTTGAEAAEAGEKVGGTLLKLAPLAALVYQLAQRLLG